MTCYAGWKLNHNKDICINKLLDFSTRSVYCCFLNYPLLHQQTERQIRKLPGWADENLTSSPGPGWMDSQPVLLEDAQVPKDAQIQNDPSWAPEPSYWVLPSLFHVLVHEVFTCFSISTPFHTCRCQAQPRAWEKTSEVSRDQSHCFPAVTCFENAMG